MATMAMKKMMKRGLTSLTRNDKHKQRNAMVSGDHEPNSRNEIMRNEQLWVATLAFLGIFFIYAGFGPLLNMWIVANSSGHTTVPLYWLFGMSGLLVFVSIHIWVYLSGT